MQLDDSAIWHESYPLKAFYFSRQKKIDDRLKTIEYLYRKAILTEHPRPITNGR